MKHRIFALLLSLLVICNLCACNQESDTQLPTIGVCFQNQQDELSASYQNALLSKLEEVGFQVTSADSRNDQAAQMRQIKSFIEQKYDLLIIEPIMINASNDIVSLLKDANIPAVFINREPEPAALELWERVCYVGSDAIQPGLLQGRIVLNTANQGDFNGDGVISYGIISGPEDHVDAQLRTQYCSRELSLGTLETLLLSVGYGDWSTKSGQRVCAQMLAQYGKDIEVIFCNSDMMALGAIQAIEAGGRVVGENLLLVGADAIPDTLDMVQNGKLTGTVSANSQGQLEQTLQAVQALYTGKAVEHRYYTDYTAITAENIPQYLDKP